MSGDLQQGMARSRHVAQGRAIRTDLTRDDSLNVSVGGSALTWDGARRGDAYLLTGYADIISLLAVLRC